ncbi:MAG TPA: RNA methyltransferase [Chloroflexota bacterium]|nr:RNA methyltransferase [Chloroflexota bacterium]
MATLVSSPANPTIKRIRALRDRKTRTETGLFYVEGIRLVGEAVELDADVDTCIVAPDLLTSEYGQGLVAALLPRARVLEVSSRVFATISSKEGPQGIAAVVRQRWTPLPAIDPSESFCWVALDEVRDPGNLGTIIRTADAVGAGGVVLAGAAADPYDPAAVRASMGAIFSQRLTRTSFDELVTWSRQHDCMLVGTSDRARTDYQAVRYHTPTVLLMGSEREGLSSGQQGACDTVVSIPMAGRSDSLNLAVATAVMLYELFNQQRSRAGIAREQTDGRIGE